MAKGKQAAALFEVIQSDKRFQGKTGVAGALRTPGWLLKAKPKTEGPAVEPAADTSAHCPVPPPLIAPTADGAGAPVTVDGQRQVIFVRLSYMSAILFGGGLLLLVVLAVLIGRALAPSEPQLGPSSDTLRHSPAEPQVMSLPERPAQVPAPVNHSSHSAPAVGQNSSAARLPAESAPTPPPPALVESNRNRSVGLNYVIVQGYPEEEKTMAAEACDVLQKNGIVCTVEKGLPKYKSDWYYVVGIDGFSRVRSPEYKAYIDKIAKISDQYAGQRSFKAFEPQGYRWSGPAGER